MRSQNLHVTNARIKKALLEAHRRKKKRDESSKTKEEKAAEWLEEERENKHPDETAGSRKVFGAWCRKTEAGEWKPREEFVKDASLGLEQWDAAKGRGLEAGAK